MTPRLLERILLVLVALAALALWGRAQRKAGAAEAEVSRLQRETRELAAAARAARAGFVRDTVRLTRTVTRWDTLAARVDTQYLELELPVPAPTVRELIAARDTTVKACWSIVSSCSAALRADSLVMRDQASTIRALVRSRPGVVRRWGERIAWALAGAVVGKATR